MKARPLAVSMGDPAGVGLEIAAAAWTQRTGATPPFALIADATALRRVAPAVRVETIGAIADAEPAFASALPVLHRPLARAETPGAPDPANAPAIIASIEEAVRLAQSGDAAGVVTLPIAKAVLYAAGFRFPGHTEYIAHLTGAAAPPVMMLAARELRVSLVTIHEPHAQVARLLTRQKIEHCVRTTHAALARGFGIVQPRIALAALNPHAGEGGALGDEEITLINPVAEALRQDGIDVSDARAADTLFHAEARAGYDAAIAMYHDQGLIPVKTLDFWGAVNVTLGLPIVRTSPDHGVAFDIAGAGRANPASFIAALRLAAEIAANRRHPP